MHVCILIMFYLSISRVKRHIIDRKNSFLRGAKSGSWKRVRNFVVGPFGLWLFGELEVVKGS